MHYFHHFYRLSAWVAVGSVLTLFLLTAPPVTYAQCNGCPVPGSQQPVPLVMPGTGLPPQSQTNPYPGGYGNGYSQFPPLGVPPAPPR